MSAAYVDAELPENQWGFRIQNKDHNLSSQHYNESLVMSGVTTVPSSTFKGNFLSNVPGT